MKILVTGADGYIGTVLNSFLLDKGYTVTGLDTKFYNTEYLYNNAIKHPKHIKKDIREIEPCDLEGFDAVIHLAELCNDPLGELKPNVTKSINYEGSKKLATLSKQVGIKSFIYSSSCSVYGSSDNKLLTEKSTTDPKTEYAKCKLQIEQFLNEIADADFSPTILRNATVYGASPRMRFDTVLNNLTGIVWTTRKIIIKSDGTPWRPLIHILDVCEGINTVLNSPKEKIHNKIFNLGDTNENYQIKELARIITDIIQNCEIITESNDRDVRSYQVSFNKIKTELNFKCKRTVFDGVKELINLFDNIKLTEEIFSSRNYTRIKQLKYLLKTKRIDQEYHWLS